ncbi:MAG: cob(I)yrinic acid a,c-diamide adenosyltransferase [Planctomycetota bacterium]|jgi:cob(I)alamin adenosyltransferase
MAQNKADEATASFGLVHVLTGRGRGKTTSALGLALRAWGTGARVSFVQFVKAKRDTGESTAAAVLGERFRFLTMGTGCARGEPTPEDREAASRALEEVEGAARSGGSDLVVADEILIALKMGLVARADIERVVESARGKVELVLTGRDAPEWLRELADYWTDMSEVKHPLSTGTRARRGVEY